MKIDVYYWSFQCPLHMELLELLDRYRDQFQIQTYDVSLYPELAKQQHMYFPT